MPCTCPIDAWPPPPGAPDRRYVFSAFASYVGAKCVRVPCGRCVGCRLDRGRQWGIRVMNEAQMAGPGRSLFATFTLSPEGLAALEEAEPLRPRGSVWKRDVQLLMKRLRKALGAGIKSFTGAEYGDGFLRPHYHSCLLHIDLCDLVPWKKSGSGQVLFRSPTLEKAWPFGFVHVGTLTQESAEYTARYAMKKVSAELAAERYRRSDADTGEVWQVMPEFGLMSKGIGASWFDEFERDCNSGFVIVDGHKAPLPRYYRLLLSAGVQARLKTKGVQAREDERRRAFDARRPSEGSDLRMMTKHEVRELKALRLLRSLDDGAPGVDPDMDFSEGAEADREAFRVAFGFPSAEVVSARIQELARSARLKGSL